MALQTLITEDALISGKSSIDIDNITVRLYGNRGYSSCFDCDYIHNTTLEEYPFYTQFVALL